jgi:beta-glucosidase
MKTIATLTLAALVAGPAYPQAGVPRRAAAVDPVEARVTRLLRQMSLEEKVGQLQQLDGEVDGRFRPEHLELAREGRLGSTLNVRGAANVNELQKAAVEGSRLKIPLLFGYDTIHGYRTIFPIPLGEAASFDAALAEETARVAAAESAAVGLKWTFAPMVDVARDPRWGRVAEGAGEDPYLGSVLARARVRGFQGADYSRPDRVVATAKHWVAYGAAEGGRDYDTTDVTERALREVYFPPFHAAVDAGVGALMSAFNDVDGVPATANAFTLTKVLRGEWGFDGLVVSDYTSVMELLHHRLAADEAEAARKALVAGTDMEMVSRFYGKHLPELVRTGAVPVAVVDEAVRRVLRIKVRAGLFENPYVDPAREKTALLMPESRTLARRAAARSMVLLRNEGGVLPLAKDARVAVVGPLADDAKALNGTWVGDGRPEDTVTILAGIREAAGAARVAYAKGCEVEGGTDAGIAAAVDAARGADAVVLVVGESAELSGEAASRSVLDLPGRQMELVRAVHAAGKPTVVVLASGRPLTIPWIAENVPAVVMAWHGGTEAGHAAADVLFGDVNPGGKLPITFPRSVGQVPLYYAHKNTGRPPDANQKYTSKYLDVPWTPQYPFGHGLSYTTFTLSDLRLGAEAITPAGTQKVAVTVTNTGARAGDEVVQLYVTDLAASVTRPVKQLRAFERVTLAPGASKTLAFTLGPQDLGLYDARMRWVVEPGRFQVTVGQSSEGGLTASFAVR